MKVVKHGTSRESQLGEIAEDYNSSKRLMMKTLADLLILTKDSPGASNLSRIINTLSDMFGELNQMTIR